MLFGFDRKSGLGQRLIHRQHPPSRAIGRFRMANVACGGGDTRAHEYLAVDRQTEKQGREGGTPCLRDPVLDTWVQGGRPAEPGDKSGTQACKTPLLR